MNRTSFKNEHLSLEVVAHEDATGKLLMLKATAAERTSDDAEPPISVSVVIDRSGSMTGRKLEIAKQAAARLVESLRSEDKVAIVIYDDQVEVLTPPVPPSKGLANLIGHIHPGGSTNLYGGWVRGAKLMTGGGRVLLLSDGLANVGRLTKAPELAEHAALSYRQYSVATSTIGIGDDYDEALMAEMARAGGGFHYFAKSADAIMEAFSRERFLMASMAVADAQLAFGDQTIEIGQLLEGEIKVVVAHVGALPKKATLSYLDAKTEQRHTCQVDLPKTFGAEPLATAYLLVQEASELMGRSMRTTSKEEAEGLQRQTRDMQLRVLNHPLADEEPLKSLVEVLRASADRLGELARYYDEALASHHRKHSAQFRHNLIERGKAYSAMPEDAEALSAMQDASYLMSDMATVAPEALALRPKEFWLSIPAIPLSFQGGLLRVGVLNPFDGFTVQALVKELGVQVRPEKRPWSRQQIEEAFAE